MSKRKPNKKRVKYFIKSEKQAIREYHVYDSDKGIKEIEHDEKHHKKFWEKRLKKLKKMS